MKCLADISYLFYLFVAAILMQSCSNVDDNQQNQQPVDFQQRKESVEKANRYVVIRENESIKDYIERHGLDMVETGTGLRYSIIKQADTVTIKRGEMVSMEYEVSLLTGDVLYSSENDGIKSFVVGRGGVESGLEEALQHMHYGDKAQIIIPSHLAHGLIGDGAKVPPRATLVYKIRILTK